MLKLVNKQLFETGLQTDVKYNNQYYYPFMTTIKSSRHIKKKVKGQEKGNSDSYYAINWDILKVYHTEEDINATTMVCHKEPDNSIVAFANNFSDYDTPVYIIAFPYNGIIKPMETPGMKYRVQQGMIAIGDTCSVKWEGEEYHKILYLSIIPNVGLFSESHKYHTNEIVLDFDSYEAIKMLDPENPCHQICDTKHSHHEKMRVIIHDTLDVSVEWTKETEDYVDMTAFKGVPIWIVSDRPKKYTEKKTENMAIPANEKIKLKYEKTISCDKGDQKQAPEENNSTKLLDEMIRNAMSEDRLSEKMKRTEKRRKRR